MKDLDFDELDRAVNSLIGGDQNQIDGEKEDTGATATASVPDSGAPTLQTLAARRSSGRFMDVVHPSSDMRSSFVPPRPTSREGLAVQPNNTSVVETPVMSTPAPETDQAVSEEVTNPEPVKSEWPDPIEFSKPFEQPVEEPAPTNVDTLPAESTTAINDSDTLPPLESPFIADAKVEKRPLGAFADEPASPVVESTLTEEQKSEPDVDLSATNVADAPSSETPMPAELQNDLLSIESNEDTSEASAPVQPVAPEATPETPIPVQSSATEVTPPVAITQQYVEQPSTGDKPAGSIFDVDSYHKPIAHPKKKKAGWLMIVWIVLLILLGIGAGAAFYFYILPTL